MILAIIQSRMGSSRLPGKALELIEGKPMLLHIVERLRNVGSINRVIIATSTHKLDNAIEDLCALNNIGCYRGSETNLADRIYKAVCEFNGDVIVRVWGDCPLIDPELIAEALKVFCDKRYDFLSTSFPERHVPCGLDFEIYKREVIDFIAQNVQDAFEQEFPCECIRRNNNKFSLCNFKSGYDLDNSIHLTVDYPQDLELMKIVYKNLLSADRVFSTKEALDFLASDPSIFLLNKSLPRNIEYIKQKREREQKI